MTRLLLWKDALKKLYSRYGIFFMAGFSFVLALLLQISVVSILGEKSILSSVVVMIGISLVCAALPAGLSTLLLLAVTGVHLMMVSVELGAVFGLACLILALLYFMLKPGNSLMICLSLLMGLFHVPGPLAMGLGLLGNPLMLIPFVSGMIMSFFIRQVKLDLFVLTSRTSSKTGIQKIMLPVSNLVKHTDWWMLLLICVIIVVLVYLIRRQAFRNSWTVAVGSGSVMCLLLALVGALTFELDVEIWQIFLQSLLTLLCGLIIQFLFFGVDYAREEYIQFEDDEYIYYVKAVPKINVAVPEVKITHFNASHAKEITPEEESKPSEEKS